METVARSLAMLALATAIVSCSFLAGFSSSWTISGSRVASEPDVFAVFWEAWRIARDDFYGETPTPREMTYASIRGMLRSLDDPYSIFVEPHINELEKDTYEGSFGGIGAWIGLEDGRLVITSTFPDSPAAEAGLRAGDIILEVDGQEIAPDMSQEEAVAMVRGPIGSEVELLISREEFDRSMLFTLIREKIETPTVTWEALNERIGYVRITLMGEQTSKELLRALDDLGEQGAQAIVLDLRDNPGGLVDSAIDVASQFLKDGVVLYQRDNDGNERAFKVRGGGSAVEIPMVILVNGGTASSAEIVAGAIRDQDRAILIGERTWGKGSVQNVHELSDGSSLHITTARWFTPLHHELEGRGLQPDIEIALTEEDRQLDEDPQLDRGQEYVEQELLRVAAPNR